MSKTRRIAGIVALILSVGFLTAVPALRQRDLEKIDRNTRDRINWGTLYRARIKAIDTLSSAAVNFHLQWDGESISPYGKGNGISVVENNEDGSKSLLLVGRLLPGGLPVSIEAEGYEPVSIRINGGHPQIEANATEGMQIIKLER